MLKLIQDMGEYIENRFYRVDLFSQNSNKAFIDVACRCLRDITLDTEVLLNELKEGGNGAEQYAPNHKFPDARFTLFNGTQFVIEINVWQSSFTEAHEHGFVGAFKLLKGAAFNAKYNFNKENYQELGAELVSGKRELTHLSDIEPNDPQIISYGSCFIHKIVHLSSPAITLIIRTKSSPGEKKQYIYNPYLAYLPTYYTDRLHQFSEYINFSHQVSDNEYWSTLVKGIEILSCKELFYFLVKEIGRQRFSAVKNKTFDLIRFRKGPLFFDSYIKPVSDDYDKDVTLGKLRSFSSKPEARILLSALILQGSVESSRQVLRKFFGDEIPQNQVEAELWALKIIDNDVGLRQSGSWDVVINSLKAGKTMSHPLLAVIKELP